jgi:hypothetical protein
MKDGRGRSANPHCTSIVDVINADVLSPRLFGFHGRTNNHYSIILRVQCLQYQNLSKHTTSPGLRDNGKPVKPK